MIIDFAQAVDAVANPQAANLLRRDLVSVAEWFGRRRLDIDVEQFYGELVDRLLGG